VEKNIQKHKFILDLMEEDNMKKNIIVFVLFNFIFPSFSLCQQYPYLRDVQIQATGSFNTNQKFYYYNYTIKNSNTSAGEISKWEIDISKNPNTVDIDTIGLLFENDGFTEGCFRRHFPSIKDKIVPIGFPKTPGGSWSGTLTNRLTAAFGGIDTDHIHTGQSLSGFEMMSKGLPAIRRCIVSPYFDVIALFPDPEDTTIHYYVPPVDSVRNAVKYYGWTVGPTAPPINFIATVWCDTLTSYTTQSRTLGWIKDDATENKYLGYFASAKTKLVQRDSVGARTVLLQVLKDVDSDSTANLNSEAYALICYNTKYLSAHFGFNGGR